MLSLPAEVRSIIYSYLHTTSDIFTIIDTIPQEKDIVYKSIIRLDGKYDWDPRIVHMRNLKDAGTIILHEHSKSVFGLHKLNKVKFIIFDPDIHVPDILSNPLPDCLLILGAAETFGYIWTLLKIVNGWLIYTTRQSIEILVRYNHTIYKYYHTCMIYNRLIKADSVTHLYIGRAPFFHNELITLSRTLEIVYCNRAIHEVIFPYVKIVGILALQRCDVTWIKKAFPSVEEIILNTKYANLPINYGVDKITFRSWSLDHNGI